MSRAAVGSNVLTPRDWGGVEHQFEESSPYNYAVLDNFLQPEVCEDLRQQLIGHWGWRRKNWVSKHLHNAKPQLPHVSRIAEELKENLPNLLGEVELISHWALMYPNNEEGSVHSDNSLVTLSVWLTPDEYNLDPSTGGLILYDVKRQDRKLRDHMVDRADRYVEAHTQGGKAAVEYRCNRAVLLDGRTFHRTDALNFRHAGADSHRLNLAFAFDRPY